MLKTNYTINKTSNIIFVCGANGESSLRFKFIEFGKANLSEFEFFIPENALGHLLTFDNPAPVNLAEFESTISNLSHMVVLFPEGPGSFAEAGYFSQVKNIANKVLIVLDIEHQSKDSFLSMGPVQIFDQHSKYSPSLEIQYLNPDFTTIANRIEMRPRSKYRQRLQPFKFSDMNEYELFCFIHKLIEIYTCCTVDDVYFFANSMFKSQISKKQINSALSILIGSGHLKRVGEYGHYRVNGDKKLAIIVDGQSTHETEIKLEIAEKLARHEDGITMMNFQGEPS